MTEDSLASISDVSDVPDASLEFVCVFGQKAHEYFDLTRTAALQTK